MKQKLLIISFLIASGIILFAVPSQAQTPCGTIRTFNVTPDRADPNTATSLRVNIFYQTTNNSPPCLMPVEAWIQVGYPTGQPKRFYLSGPQNPPTGILNLVQDPISLNLILQEYGQPFVNGQSISIKGQVVFAADPNEVLAESLASFVRIDSGAAQPTPPPPGSITPSPGNIAPPPPGSIPSCADGSMPVNGQCVIRNPASQYLVNIDNFGDLLKRIIEVALFFAGAIALIFLIIGGFQYIAARGNEEATEKAKKTITGAVLGIVIIIMAFAIVTIVSNLVTRGPQG